MLNIDFTYSYLQQAGFVGFELGKVSGFLDKLDGYFFVGVRKFRFTIHKRRNGVFVDADDKIVKIS